MNKRCVIHVYGGSGIQFIDRKSCYTTEINDAMIFPDELSAHEYIDHFGIDHITKVLCIKEEKDTTLER